MLVCRCISKFIYCCYQQFLVYFPLFLVFVFHFIGYFKKVYSERIFEFVKVHCI